jgi:hypothetical protein
MLQVLCGAGRLGRKHNQQFGGDLWRPAETDYHQDTVGIGAQLLLVILTDGEPSRMFVGCSQLMWVHSQLIWV